MMTAGVLVVDCEAMVTDEGHCTSLESTPLQRWLVKYSSVTILLCSMWWVDEWAEGVS